MPQTTQNTLAEPLQALVTWLIISNCLFVLLYFGSCFAMWFRWGLGRGVSLLAVIRARIRGIPPKPLIQGIAYAKDAKLNLAPRDLELISLAGGDIVRSVTALQAAQKAQLDFSYKKLIAMLFERRDPLGHVLHLLRLRDEGMQNEACRITAEELRDLLGEEGIVEFAISPPGIVRVNDTCIAAVSGGGYIDKGTLVKIVGTRGNVAVVERKEQKGAEK